MKKLQVGNVFYENEDTKAIYDDFPEYFDVTKEYDWLVKYTISRNPSEELIQAIENYYAKVKEKNRKRDEFVYSVAKEVYDGLSDDDKAYIFDHPDSTRHHFGMGLGIRNKYIHSQKLDFEVGHPDNLSSEITLRIASMVIDSFDYENPFYRSIYDDFTFSHLRRLYKALMGDYPDSILEKYADEPDEYEAAKKAKKKVRSIVLDVKRFKKLASKYQLTEIQYRDFKEFVDAYNAKNWDIIPYDVAILCSRKMDADERTRWLQLMEAVLKQAPRLALEMPTFVFNQKDSVLLAVSAMGISLKRFKKFNADEDVIVAALHDNGEAIQYVNKELRYKDEYIRLALSSEYGDTLKMRCMIPYRDNEELVKIALEANGRNIEWASERIKDDFEMAAFAIINQKDYYPESTVCNLSARLRDNLDIALLDIREGHACIRDYSKRLRDNDEVAKALLETENSWKIYQMSKRIQKLYDQED